MGSHFNTGEAVAANEFGMAIDKGGAQREGQQQNEGDGGQLTVIDGLTVAVFGNGLSAMSAGVQKAMLKRPMLSEIVSSRCSPESNDHGRAGGRSWCSIDV